MAGSDRRVPRGRPQGGRPKAPDKEAERKQAQELAARTGVPLWGAFRVIRGEVKLNELLQSMLRREKFRKLRDRDGLDPDLAGHVAGGSLPKWRADVLQEMRRAGRTKFTRDRIAMAHKESLPIAIWQFGQDDWNEGRIVKARTYDFNFADLTAADDADPAMIFKHDVKMVCNPHDLEGMRAARKFEKSVLNEGLGSSRERRDRYRPTDAELCAARDNDAIIKWVFRDGTAIRARVHAFGRWDIDVLTDDGTPGTVFFHALHAATGKAMRRFAG